MFQKAFKTIVVGVDFSDYSKVVVKQARLLSRLWDTKLVLVHAIHDPVVYSPSLYISFPNVVSEKSYEDRIKKVYNTESSSTVKIIARRGTPAALILDVAGRHPQPLVVAGYKGHNKIAEFFFGSTAQSLIIKSKIPVWIHRGNKVIKPEKVLIPHDLSVEANHSIDIVKKLSLATPLGYEVYFVREKAFPVLDYQVYKAIDRKLMKKTDKKIKNLLANYPQISFVDAANGNVTNQVVKHTKKFDLLVMSHHNPTGLFSKSETVDLMKHVKTPILVTH